MADISNGKFHWRAFVLRGDVSQRIFKIFRNLSTKDPKSKRQLLMNLTRSSHDKIRNLDLSAYEVENNCCLFERLIKVKKNGLFLFGISF